MARDDAAEELDGCRLHVQLLFTADQLHTEIHNVTLPTSVHPTTVTASVYLKHNLHVFSKDAFLTPVVHRYKTVLNINRKVFCFHRFLRLVKFQRVTAYSSKKSKVK